MKKLLSIFFTTVIALSIICIAAFTSSAIDVNIGVYAFSNLKYHIENSDESETFYTIALTDDIVGSIEEGIDFSKGKSPNITIDLNGHHLKINTTKTDTRTCNLFNINREVNFTIIDSKNSDNGYIEFNSKGVYSTIVNLNNAKANFTNYNVEFRKCYDTNYRANSEFSGSAIRIEYGNRVHFLGGSVNSYRENDVAIYAGSNNNVKTQISELVFAGNVELYSEQPSGNGTLTFFKSNIATMTFYGCKIRCGTINKLAVYNASGADFASLIGDKQNLYKFIDSTNAVDAIKNGTYSYSGNFSNEFKLEYNNCGTNVHVSNVYNDFHVVVCNNCNGYVSSGVHTGVTIPSVEATCATSGKSEGQKCSVCNFVTITPKAIPPKGHTPVAIPGTPATCTATGLTDGTKCSTCDEILVARIVISKLAHTPEELPAVAATCTATGLTKGSQCSVCNEILVAQTETAKLGHTDSNNNLVCDTCGAAVVAGKAVKSLKASSNASTSIKLTWAKLSGATGYRVYKYSAAEEKYVSVKTVSTNSFTDTAVSANKTYYYKIRAYKNVGGKNNYCDYSSTLKTYTAPAKVSNLKTSTYATTSLKLSWAKSSGAAGYIVYKYNNSTKKWDTYKTVTANSLTVTKLKAGTSYKFRVKAFRTVGSNKFYGDYSATLTTATRPSTPKLSSVTSTKSNSIKPTWKKVSPATGYEIQYSLKKNFSSGVTKKLITKNSTLSATYTGLKSGKIYYVRVRAYTTVGSAKVYSAYSTINSVKVK